MLDRPAPADDARAVTARRAWPRSQGTPWLTALVAPLVVLCAGAAPARAESSLRDLALARLPLVQAISGDPAVLSALREKNASGETADEIRARDAAWTGAAPFTLRQELASSACAQRLRELTRDDPAVVEVILMDRNGANVCVSRETSDYWQGDEDKFKQTFGAGHELHLGDAALDQSTGTYAIQLSVLVRDGGAKAGALTLGLRVTRRELVGR